MDADKLNIEPFLYDGFSKRIYKNKIHKLKLP